MVKGVRYFLYEPKRTYTDADIYDPHIHRHAMRLINEMDAYTRKRYITLSNNVDIVLDLFYEAVDDICLCQYYIADHATRSIFWLDNYEMDQMIVWSEVKGVTELSHIRGILSSVCIDVLASMSSTIPYSIEELQQMLSLTHELGANFKGQGGAVAYG
ncbi:hypothetical protein V5O48_008339 [Marasmius crinis-equi]|uniref:Uncharacterized protein n=1 Tax=Marasmius crinis-equi TaxID=585013 RepID=A0ABR3FEG9_9AGAR